MSARPRIPGLLLLLAAMTDPAAASERFDYGDLLEQMVDLRWLATAPSAGERGYQFSSFDRASRKGRSDPEAWYANADAGNFLETEPGGDASTHVLADCPGPGAVVRIWSANPRGTLRIFIDGALSLEVPFTDLCSGKVKPFVEPFCGVRARGWNCYLPFPFRKHLRITSTEGGFYYHVNIRQLPPGTEVPSFRENLLEEHGSRLEEIGSILARPDRVHPGPTSGPGSATRVVPAGKRRTLLRKEGSGVLRRLALTPKSKMKTPEKALRAARLRVFVDDRPDPTVDCPLGDFFGSAPGLNPQGGYPLGVTPEGVAYCNFPMPCSEGITVELVNEGDEEILLDCQWIFERGPTEDLPLRFHAGFAARNDLATHPRQDLVILQTEGAGRFVGCTYTIRNPVRSWWGEGDEHFFVDGEEFPSTFGTGTEDYFGYAWCSPELFRHPFHNQSRCDGPDNYGYSSVNRFQILDQIPFRTSMRFDMELWHWKECTVDVATVAYWYQSPAGPLPFEEIAVEDRIPRPSPPYQVFRVEGALEGEALPVVSCTGGVHGVQDLSQFGDDWSGEKHLWWRDGEVGDRLTLAFDSPRKGKGRLLARFTLAHDYGILEISVNGTPIGKPLDFYDTRVTATGELDLGEVELHRGKNQIAFEIVGKNEKAVPRHMFGLDYLRLEEVE